MAVSSFASYIIFTMAVVACIPLGVYILGEAGLGIDAHLGETFDDYAAPDIANYVPENAGMIDAALAYLMWGITAAVWFFTLAAKALLIYPVLTGFFGVPDVFALPISIMIGLSAMFFLFRVIRGYSVED
jgi:hypothetical protein